MSDLSTVLAAGGPDLLCLCRTGIEVRDWNVLALGTDFAASANLHRFDMLRSCQSMTIPAL